MKLETTPLTVRRVQFEYPGDLKAHWHPQRPEWSQLVNASSLLMPYLEPYLIASVRAALPLIKDPAVAEEARGYIGQEANHFRQHRRFNDLLLQQGYEALRGYEQQLERDYARFNREHDLQFHLGYAAGFETMALAVGHMLIKHRRVLFEGADPTVSSLVLWHFVEELEHKTAAYNVYQAIYGGSVSGYAYRVWALAGTAVHTLGRTAQAFMQLQRIDGRARHSRLATWGLVARIAVWTLPKLLHGALPWHQPAQVKNPRWMDRWLALYAENPLHIAPLDTRDMSADPQPLTR